ncbi:hypothetical protein A3B39_03615 [Candidatus Daviesbacteria bacterium RIFCSPLOWO2_01_FULL_37_10]|nr:MAG: hypothetical protein A3B39_03615 [Candidatus Daviesbacteria bacterium RIFCSPLOWO2_01_FULL_37_10]
MDSQGGQTSPVQPDIGSSSEIASSSSTPRNDAVESGILYDVIVIGGGPAGVAAAVYTARKQLKTLVIADSFGGQSLVSDDIQNWIGDTHISGTDLAKKLEEHVRAYPDMVDIKTEKVTSVKSVACVSSSTPGVSAGVSAGRLCDFEVKTEAGNTYKGRTVIVASGARRRKLGIPGEDQYGGKGVAYCSTCDAPLFKDKKVAVIGGGNAGLEAVQDLFQYASEVYLLEHGDAIRGDAKTFEEIKKNAKLKEVILNVDPLEVLGETLVTGLKFKNSKTGEEKTLEVGGVFIEIGSVPNSEMVKDLVQIDEYGQIIVNFQHARTSHPGVFAAGDVTNDPYKQNNISVGDGVRAALAAHAYLLDRAKASPAEERPHA